MYDNIKGRVLYLGDKSGTSLHRANAFKRLGYDVYHISPRSYLPKSVWFDRIEWKLSPFIIGFILKFFIQRDINHLSFDLVWVDSGSLISAELVAIFTNKNIPVINFNHDDPFGRRDWIRFKEYRRAVSSYSLVVVVRQENIKEAHALGARKVVCVTRTADEVAHSPLIITADIYKKWKSDVSFVGTWMPGRDNFILSLLESGLSVTIYGSGWWKSPEWSRLKLFHRSSHLEGLEYVYAVQCSTISIGLLSELNRDLHTTRSIEIPYIGGLLCAQRTSEHKLLYQEGVEAFFWDDAIECAAICKKILSNPNLRDEVARNGRERAIKNENTSQKMIEKILREVAIDFSF